MTFGGNDVLEKVVTKKKTVLLEYRTRFQSLLNKTNKTNVVYTMHLCENSNLFDVNQVITRNKDRGFFGGKGL